MATSESYRRSKDWTQDDLAERLGIASKGYISRLENGEQDWPLELALRMQLLSEGEVLARDLVPEDKRELLDQLIRQSDATPTAGAAEAAA